MGLIEDIDALDISDELKAPLLASARKEAEDKKLIERRSRKATLEAEIKELGELGLSEEPGAYKYLRHVFLSDDPNEVSVVLLSDDDLGLSGDDRVGATERKGISTKEAFTTFFSLLSKNNDGKLKLMLSDQGHASQDRELPADEDTTEARNKAASEELDGIMGGIQKPTGKRYGKVGV